MNFNKKKRLILVSLFRVFITLLTLVIFIIGFSQSYPGLRSFTRTLAIVIASFLFVTTWMSYVYGKLDIGEKKTKPLFINAALNLLITDSITFLAVIVMTINNKNISFLTDLGTVFIVYIVQLIVIRILIGVANNLYYSNYVPGKTVIVSDGTEYLAEVSNYLQRHKKQYEIKGIISSNEVQEMVLDDVEHIFLINADFDTIRTVVLDTMKHDTKIYYNASIDSVLLSNKETFIIDDILFFLHRSNNINVVQLVVKRVLDIIFSFVGLLFALPIMMIVAIMIKLDDGGPIFFSHERVTKNGKPFKIYKFRSMKINSEEKWAEENDDRITRAGHIVRKLRLDELPQLYNILKGDMSIVGPRPETVNLTKKFMEELPEFELRQKVKAGLTGTAQILGKYNTTPKDKLYFDLYYIENFSIFNDINLMFQTLAVFTKKDSTEGVIDDATEIK